MNEGSGKLRVLMISRQFPHPPWDGDVLPIHHFVRQLASRVELTLLTLWPPDGETRAAGTQLFESWGVRVQGVQARPLTAVARTLSFLRDGVPWANRFYEPGLRAAAADLLSSGEFDVAHAESILSAQHLPRVTAAPVVLFARDCQTGWHRRLWEQERRPIHWLNVRKIGALERAMLRRARLALTIAESERLELDALGTGTPLRIVPNGVDTEQLQTAPCAPRDPATVVFTGAMSYAPNIDGALWLAREIWPAARRRCPDARLLLVGRDPAPEVRALADEEAGIEVTGSVPDMRPYLARATVVVSPLRYGAGMKNKVLEAGAMNCAIVATPASLENLALEPGRDVVAADTAGRIADAVVALLGDAARRMELGRNARERIVAEYSWERGAESIVRAYRDAIAGGNL